jgi:hypothetical protein
VAGRPAARSRARPMSIYRFWPRSPVLWLPMKWFQDLGNPPHYGGFSAHPDPLG